MNCAFNNKYNPARPAKLSIRNKALITAFFLVTINTDDTAEVIPKTKNKIICKCINYGRWLMVDVRCGCIPKRLNPHFTFSSTILIVTLFLFNYLFPLSILHPPSYNFHPYGVFL